MLKHELGDDRLSTRQNPRLHSSILADNSNRGEETHREEHVDRKEYIVGSGSDEHGEDQKPRSDHSAFTIILDVSAQRSATEALERTTELTAICNELPMD